MQQCLPQLHLYWLGLMGTSETTVMSAVRRTPKPLVVCWLESGGGVVVRNAPTTTHTHAPIHTHAVYGPHVNLSSHFHPGKTGNQLKC